MKARYKLSPILLMFVLLLTIFVMPTKSNIELLPQIDYNYQYEVRNINGILIEKINALRDFYGFLPVSESVILNNSAKYKAVYISQYPDIDTPVFKKEFITGPMSGSEYLSLYPYVKNEDITYITDGRLLSDEDVSEYLIKTWENTYKQGLGIFNPDIKLIGVSVLWFNIKGNSYTVCIVHTANETLISEESNRVPDKVIMDDSTAPIVTTEEVYIAKDLILTGEKIEKAVKYSDNSGEDCILSFDLSGINTAKLGTYNQEVSVTDASKNVTKANVKVHVVPHIYPVINNEEIVLPIISFEDVYEISRYINVSDNYGIENITVNPSVVNKDEAGKQVAVIVLNKAGLSVSKTISIRYESMPSYISPSVTVSSLFLDLDEPFTIEILKATINTKEQALINIDFESFEKVKISVPGTYYVKASVKVNDITTVIAVPVYIGVNQKKTMEVTQNTVNEYLEYSKLNRTGGIKTDDHIILTSTNVSCENAVYNYTFKNYDGEEYTIRRSIPSVIWNPDKEGLYRISLNISDKETGETYSTSYLNLYVEKKVIGATNSPYIGLSQESVYVADDANKKIINISPNTKTEDFIKNFVIHDEGINDVGLRIKDKDGNIISGSNLIGTGSKIELHKEEITYESYVIILYGDVNGDGYIDITDYVLIRHYILGNISINDLGMLAANIAERDKTEVNISDYVMLRQHILKNYVIQQK